MPLDQEPTSEIQNEPVDKGTQLENLMHEMCRERGINREFANKIITQWRQNGYETGLYEDHLIWYKDGKIFLHHP